MAVQGLLPLSSHGNHNEHLCALKATACLRNVSLHEAFIQEKGSRSWTAYNCAMR